MKGALDHTQKACQDEGKQSEKDLKYTSRINILEVCAVSRKVGGVRKHSRRKMKIKIAFDQKVHNEFKEVISV